MRTSAGGATHLVVGLALVLFGGASLGCGDDNGKGQMALVTRYKSMVER